MELDFEKLGGLVPAIVQDHATGEVLMLGFMDSAALAETLRSGDVTFFSRSRKKLWKKGEQSGHRLRLQELLVDCDADAVVARVEPLGPGVCHEGYRSCFFRRLNSDGTTAVLAAPAFDPSVVYGKERR
ncbi:MAG: phosphoribosyl-AMP cyclohydrolase [Candidatus Acidiferrales bacterium]